MVNMFFKKLKYLNLQLLLATTLLCTISVSCSKTNNNHKNAESNPKIKLGIDNIDTYSDLFKNQRVGLITNPTGVNGNFKSTIEILKSKTNLVALFSPEHGIRGTSDAGASVTTYIDRKTGLPVYSLYKNEIKPISDSVLDGSILSNIDVLAFDIQDVGSRFYTYISTMKLMMDICKRYNKTFIVFDRPNPINGSIIEGGILNPKYESFVGIYPIPIRYGLTIGELARVFNKSIQCKLHVILMSGWHRNMFWEDTGLPWVMPSPNMRTSTTALAYAGTCLLEGTNISEGRGTGRPFELIGAPWINAEKLARSLNSLKLPGVTFIPTYFTPAYSKYKDETCRGIRIDIIDKHHFQAVTTGIAILYTVKRLYKNNFKFTDLDPKYGKYWIDLLTGNKTVREGNLSINQLIKKWDKDSKLFKQYSSHFYLYN